MSEGEAFKFYRAKVQRSRPSLSKVMADAGYPATESAIQQWELGANRLPLNDEKFRLAITKVFECSLSEFLARAGYEVPALSRHEIELLDKLNTLSDRDRRIVEMLIDEMLS